MGLAKRDSPPAGEHGVVVAGLPALVLVADHGGVTLDPLEVVQRADLDLALVDQGQSVDALRVLEKGRGQDHHL
jgi:hypothetical protein